MATKSLWRTDSYTKYREIQVYFCNSVWKQNCWNYGLRGGSLFICKSYGTRKGGQKETNSRTRKWIHSLSCFECASVLIPDTLCVLRRNFNEQKKTALCCIDAIRSGKQLTVAKCAPTDELCMLSTLNWSRRKMDITAGFENQGAQNSNFATNKILTSVHNMTVPTNVRHTSAVAKRTIIFFYFFFTNSMTSLQHFLTEQKGRTLLLSIHRQIPSSVQKAIGLLSFLARKLQWPSRQTVIFTPWRARFSSDTAMYEACEIER